MNKEELIRNLFVVTETQNIVFRKCTKFEVLEDALIIYDEELVIGYFKTNNIVGFYVNDVESKDKE